MTPPRYAEPYTRDQQSDRLDLEREYFRSVKFEPIHAASQRFWYTPKATFTITRQMSVTGEAIKSEVLQIPVEPGWTGAVYIRDVQLMLRPVSDMLGATLLTAMAATYAGVDVEFGAALTIGEVGISLNTGWAGLDLPKAIAANRLLLTGHPTKGILPPVAERESFSRMRNGAAPLFPDKNGMYLVTLTTSSWYNGIPASVTREAIVVWDIMIRWDYGA